MTYLRKIYLLATVNAVAVTLQTVIIVGVIAAFSKALAGLYVLTKAASWASMYYAEKFTIDEEAKQLEQQITEYGKQLGVGNA